MAQALEKKHMDGIARIICGHNSRDATSNEATTTIMHIRCMHVEGYPICVHARLHMSAALPMHVDARVHLTQALAIAMPT